MKGYKITIVGQGYVGFPLAIEFAKHFPVIGYDINHHRIKEISSFFDRTQEVPSEAISEALKVWDSSFKQKGYFPTSNEEEIKSSNLFIITVPTPIDRFNAPDLEPLKKATKTVASILKINDIVIFESTVYPGCTEEECVPILEKYSGLKYNQDFFVGYSPERINPGDKKHTLTTIKKVTSGSTEIVAEKVDQLYQTIIIAGTHKAPSIKVAEASKAIENAQRDVNISFVNELALIFDRMGIDTNDVLEAAGTKYNFLKYQPGLVGGHCISVDPYYLTYKAVQLGYHPNVIMSGRRVNNSLPEFIASKVVKLMITKNIPVKGAAALILGVTFKENCPDIRNSKVIDVYNNLNSYGMSVDIHDPLADYKTVKSEYGVNLLPYLAMSKKYDLIVLAVAHNEYIELDILNYKKENAVVFDIKACLDKSIVDGRL